MGGREPLDRDLGGEWAFAYSPAMDGEPPRLPGDAAFDATIEVPGYWDDQTQRFETAAWFAGARRNPDYAPIVYPIKSGDTPDASLPFLMGVGWYRRRIDVPAEWAGRTVRLDVGGVVLEAWGWLNGEPVGHHLGPWTPFAVDLTPALRPGEANMLTIAVSNLREEVSGCGLRGYHGKGAGVCGAVSLHVGGAGAVDDLFLYPDDDLSGIEWRATLRSSAGVATPTRLRWRILDADGRTELAAGEKSAAPIAARGEQTVAWRRENPSLEPWRPEDPRRYVAEVTWLDDDGVIDRRRQAFGLRRLRRDGTGLRLNGRPVMLRGVCEHYYFPQTCTAPRSVEAFRRRLEMLKQIGFNFVRFHTWVPTREYLDAADEIGMLLQPEKPVGPGLDAWADIIRACRRHPSVASYCYGNEEILDEAKIGEIERAAEIARRLDPTCLVMPMEAMRGIEYVWQPPELPPEQTVSQPFRHHAARLKRLSRSADLYGQYSWGLLSYVSLRGDWRELERRYTVYDRPLIAHEVGISGCYPDLSLEDRYRGRVPPEIYRDLRRRLTEAGRLHMADTYYRHSARWQALVLRYMFETLRRCDRIKGCDLLGGWDQHWHHGGYGCGLLNEFLELKDGRTAESVRRYTGESVVLLDLGLGRSFRGGEDFAAEVSVSLYGGRDLSGGTLQWRLLADGSVLLRGSSRLGDAPDGHVTPVGAIEFTWPTVPTSCKTTLEVRVRGAGYDLANAWDLWLFAAPAVPRTEADMDADAGALLAACLPGGAPTGTRGAKLRVVSTLGDDDLRHLGDGGDVLLLGAAPLPSRRTSFQITVAGRSGGNMATVIAEHPVWRGFPHEGWCDWQFASLMDATATVFNELDAPFEPILEVVSSYKDLQWQASVWELAVDAGRLFAATCRFDPADPAAAALLGNIVAYVGSDGFRPARRAAGRSLAAWLDSPTAAQGLAATEMGFDPNAPQNRRAVGQVSDSQSPGE